LWITNIYWYLNPYEWLDTNYNLYIKLTSFAWCNILTSKGE
jgi:hypothetical protein